MRTVSSLPFKIILTLQCQFGSHLFSEDFFNLQQAFGATSSPETLEQSLSVPLTTSSVFCFLSTCFHTLDGVAYLPSWIVV